MKGRYTSQDYIGLRLYTRMDSRTFFVENISLRKKVCKAPTWEREEKLAHEQLILALELISHLVSGF